MWKKGLGTSVDIDTENVSENSTKSAKITNAALYQGVNLTADEKYTLSFDIYLDENFNQSKLSWGIFVMNGNYINNSIGYGYKEGAENARKAREKLLGFVTGNRI